MVSRPFVVQSSPSATSDTQLNAPLAVTSDTESQKGVPAKTSNANSDGLSSTRKRKRSIQPYSDDRDPPAQSTSADTGKAALSRSSTVNGISGVPTKKSHAASDSDDGFGDSQRSSSQHKRPRASLNNDISRPTPVNHGLTGWKRYHLMDKRAKRNVNKFWNMIGVQTEEDKRPSKKGKGKSPIEVPDDEEDEADSGMSNGHALSLTDEDEDDGPTVASSIQQARSGTPVPGMGSKGRASILTSSKSGNFYTSSQLSRQRSPVASTSASASKKPDNLKSTTKKSSKSEKEDSTESSVKGKGKAKSQDVMELSSSDKDLPKALFATASSDEDAPSHRPKKVRKASIGNDTTRSGSALKSASHKKSSRARDSLMRPLSPSTSTASSQKKISRVSPTSEELPFKAKSKKLKEKTKAEDNSYRSGAQESSYERNGGRETMKPLSSQSREQQPKKTSQLPRRVLQVAGDSSPESSSSSTARMKKQKSDALINGVKAAAKQTDSWKGSQGPPTPGTTAKEKRLQQQLQMARAKTSQIQDNFDELSDAYAVQQVRTDELEQSIAHLKRQHQEEVVRLTRRMAGKGDETQSTNMQLQSTSVDLLNLRKENDEMVIAHREEIEKLNAYNAELIHSKDEDLANLRKERSNLQDSYEEKIQILKRSHEQEIEELQDRIQNSRLDVKLGMKEREIDSLKIRHLREMDSMAMKIDGLNMQLQAQRQSLQDAAEASMYGVNTSVPQVSNLDGLQQDSSMPQVNGHAPENAALLQQLRKVRRDKEDLEAYMTALQETYQSKIRRLERELRDKENGIDAEFNRLELARSSLEHANERARTKIKSLTSERDALQREINYNRALIPEAERLKAANPVLITQNRDLLNVKDALTKENTQMRTERTIYINQIEAVRQELQALQIEFVSLQGSHGPGPASARTEMEALKRRHTKERQLFKAEILRLRQLVKGKGRATDESGEDDDDFLAISSLDEGSYVGSDNEQPDLANGHSISQRSLDQRSPYLDNLDLFDKRPTPELPPPATSEVHKKARKALDDKAESAEQRLLAFEATQPAYDFPPLLRKRRPDSKVPKHRSRVYLRSECHTPYVADEIVSDSDDEFLEWEHQAYAKSQMSNPDPEAAVVNVCWNRHILDARGQRDRTMQLQFCTEFVQSYGPLIISKNAENALLMHILELVRLGQLTSDEGSQVMKHFNRYKQ